MENIWDYIDILLSVALFLVGFGIGRLGSKRQSIKSGENSVNIQNGEEK